MLKADSKTECGKKKITFQNFRILKLCLTLDVILGGRVTYK
jgi:hypothetical protein